ncbi:hypothetical protein V1511DRAFT_501328 [Dipodascopsis uninucleata]
MAQSSTSSKSPTIVAARRLWASGDPDRLLRLAQQIDAHEGWRGYLTRSEHELFAAALRAGGETWSEFISIEHAQNVVALRNKEDRETHGFTEDNTSDQIRAQDDDKMSVTGSHSPNAGSLQTPQPSPMPNNTSEDQQQRDQQGKENTDSSNGSADSQSASGNSSTIDVVELAAKTRYMLFEKSVNCIFPNAKSEEYAIDFSFLDELDEKEADKSSTLEKPAPVHSIRKDDDNDDYDEDDDEDDEKEEQNSASQNTQENLETQQNKPVKQGTKEGSQLKEESGEDKNERESKDSKESCLADGIITPAETPTASETNEPKQFSKDTYHTLDTEAEAFMKAVRPKEDVDSRAEHANNIDLEGNSEGGVASKLSNMNFGAANLSLKHLLAAIDDKRQQLSFTDSELRNLISDVRKNRSKWASEDRIGQEELYDAAEKVVLELRGYTEHSTAFLNKVNKRDAPNYFNIIKRPMDLSTVMKKLKSFQYKSKHDFVEDLMLIWNNCFEFNTDPQHYLRKHAQAMKEKTLLLIPLIPDITIRSRAEIEARERGSVPRDMSIDFDLESEDNESVTGSRKNISSRTDGKTVPSTRAGSVMTDNADFADEDDTQHVPQLQQSQQESQREMIFEYDVIPIVPEVPWNLAEKQTVYEAEEFDRAVDVDAPSKFLPLKTGLNLKMDKNLAELQQIRKICSKISVIRRIQQQPHLYTTQMKAYNPEKIDERDVDMDARLPGREDLPREVIEACMQRSIAKLAMHTGFEDCQMLALEGLTGIATDFMQKLGRTLNLYREANRGQQRFNMEDIVLQTLYENGVYDLGGLETYIRDEIDRFGLKLKDVHERMNMSLADYLRPALASTEDNQFEDGSQEFISGTFSDDIGEDFFGFRELGLDEELGLSTMSVPLHLLHSRLHMSANVQATPVMQSKVASAPPMEPLTRDLIEKQIGLVRPFLFARFDKFERDGVLLEDELLPPKQRNQRPKLPPTGKIAMAKKRSSETAFQMPSGVNAALKSMGDGSPPKKKKKL